MVLSLELATGYCICFESSLIFEFLICILHLRFAIVSNTCILHLYWFHVLVGRPTDGRLGCGTFEGQAASLERARSESTRISTFEFCISICILLLHLYYFHILAGRPVDGEVLILRRKCQSRKECLTLHLHFVFVFCICILHLYFAFVFTFVFNTEWINVGRLTDGHVWGRRCQFWGDKVRIDKEKERQGQLKTNKVSWHREDWFLDLANHLTCLSCVLGEGLVW